MTVEKKLIPVLVVVALIVGVIFFMLGVGHEDQQRGRALKSTGLVLFAVTAISFWELK